MSDPVGRLTTAQIQDAEVCNILAGVEIGCMYILMIAPEQIQREAYIQKQGVGRTKAELDNLTALSITASILIYA